MALRSDPSFVWPGTDHLAAAAPMLARRAAIVQHEHQRMQRQAILRARNQINTHLTEGLRRGVSNFRSPPGIDEHDL